MAGLPTGSNLVNDQVVLRYQQRQHRSIRGRISITKKAELKGLRKGNRAYKYRIDADKIKSRLFWRLTGIIPVWGVIFALLLVRYRALCG
jgi:hypothetical protein